jgi:diacylglycerol kinase (ATP)
MEVAAGVMGSDVPMAIIPGGTANVMSVELGIPGDSKEACKLICDIDSALVRSVDMGQVGDQYFMLRVGMGFEAALVEGADRETKAKVGTLAYVLSGLQALANPVLARYQLTLDGKKVEVEGITCMVANSGSLGTPGLRLAPTVDVSDGLLDVIVIRKGDLGSILSVVASVVTGNENAEPLQHWQARHVHVESTPQQSVQADGEIINTTPIDIKVLPNILKVLVPRPPEATEAAKVQDTNTEAGTLGAMPAMV